MAIVTAPPTSSRSPGQPDREEAEERAALLEVDRYDVALDLRGLFEGEVLEATSTVTFAAAARREHLRGLHRARSVTRP